MPSHFQFTAVFCQLQFMTSQVLCGGQFKPRFHWYSRETFNHLKYFNKVDYVVSFLLTPKSQTFKSFTVWQLGKPRNHPRETILHSLNQYLVFLITRWPHWCAVWAYQWPVLLQQDLFRLINNCSVSHTYLGLKSQIILVLGVSNIFAKFRWVTLCGLLDIGGV